MKISDSTKTDRAFEIAAELAFLPGYPRGNDPKYAIGEMLGEICQNTEQLEAVYKEIKRKGERWTGPKMIRDVHAELYPKSSPLLPDCEQCGNTGRLVEIRILPDCPKCNNTSWRLVEEGSSHERCDCGRDVNGFVPSVAVPCGCGHKSSNDFSMRLDSRTDKNRLLEYGCKVNALPKHSLKKRKGSSRVEAVDQLSFE